MSSNLARMMGKRRRLPLGLNHQMLFSNARHGNINSNSNSQGINTFLAHAQRSFSSKRKNTSVTHELAMRLEEIWSQNTWFVPRKGTGFDNFLPKDKKADRDKKEGDKDGKVAEESKKNEGKEKKDEPSSKKSSGSNWNDPFRSSSFSGGTGGSGSGPNLPPFGGTVSSLMLLLFSIYLYSRLDDEDGSSADPFSSREITWQDFCNHLLETNQVEKIVVTSNRTMAKVFLKPGAPGLPQSSRLVRYSDRRMQGGSGEGQTNFGTSSSDGTEGFSTESGMSSSTDSFGSSVATGGQKGQQTIYRFAIGSIDTFEKKLEEAQKAVGMDRNREIPVQYAPETTMSSELLSVVPSLLFMGLAVYFMRFASGSMSGQGGRGGMGGMFQVGKSTAKKIKPEDVKINFTHVAGCDEAKKEVMEFVDFLQDPTRFTKLGAKTPKGALLCGPPGTGKTLLAKAVAGEAGVPFFSISGSDFIEMFVGVGPSRVRDLFKEARATAPCIVFIDEIDAVGRQRGRGAAGGNDERENTLNQLLVEMDGFEPSTGVVVLAGTNRVDILDQALTRPGRFDRQITVDKPDLAGRRDIFKVHLAGITLEDSIDDVAGRLAGLTPGFAGADIANVCNEAAIVAARREGETVSIEDFEKAADRIIGGLESNKIMSVEERSIVAHHEAGHAIAGWFLEHTDPLLKVTIIPRTSGALGFAQYLPKEVFLRTEEQIMDIVCMALAGRAAEDIFFGRVTTGASDDLRRVTDLVYSTIQLYGMNERLGQLAFPKDPNAMWDERPYSEKTAKAMDEEARRIVDAAYQRTLDLLNEHKDQVETIAKMLLDKETIVHDDIVDAVGPRPYKGDSAYDEFVRRRQEVKKTLTPAQSDADESASVDDAGSDPKDGMTPNLAFRSYQP